MNGASYEDLFVEVCAGCRMVQRTRRDGFEFHQKDCPDLHVRTKIQVYTSEATALLDGPVHMPPRSLADLTLIGEA